MGSTLVVGLQWGDEAKGKVVDLLTDRHDLVVRYNGGANAGHTVVVDGVKYKLSLCPSGITRPGMECVIGNGVALDPAKLISELDGLAKQGLDYTGRLWLSDRAHVILPYHMEWERVLEEAAGDRAIGTTRRGIGPCYADKADRRDSLRVRDLIDPARLRSRLEEIVPRKNRMIGGMSEHSVRFHPGELHDTYAGYAERLRPLVIDTFWHLQRALAENKRILFEAAQGSLLDIDHGSFPFVTSSNSSSCGLHAGCGVSPRRIERYIGICKAYTTRVGAGPFPSELLNATGEHIRHEGNEFGTVTGRPRRCGWFDAVATRYSAVLNGIDCVAVMLLDVLSKLEEVSICEAYEIDGERTTEFPPDASELARAKPVLRTLPGWKRDICGCRQLSDLPAPARAYVDAIAEHLNVPVFLVSVGPDRTQTILV